MALCRLPRGAPSIGLQHKKPAQPMLQTCASGRRPMVVSARLRPATGKVLGHRRASGVPHVPVQLHHAAHQALGPAYTTKGLTSTHAHANEGPQDTADSHETLPPEVYLAYGGYAARAATWHLQSVLEKRGVRTVTAPAASTQSVEELQRARALMSAAHMVVVVHGVDLDSPAEGTDQEQQQQLLLPYLQACDEGAEAYAVRLRIGSKGNLVAYESLPQDRRPLADALVDGLPGCTVHLADASCLYPDAAHNAVIAEDIERAVAKAREQLQASGRPASTAEPAAAAARLRADKAALAALAVEQLRQGVAAAQTVQGLQAQLQELRQRLEAAGGGAGAAPNPDAAEARSDAADKGSDGPNADVAVITQLRGLKTTANELEWSLGEVDDKVDELATAVEGISQDMAEFEERVREHMDDTADEFDETLRGYLSPLCDTMDSGFPKLQQELVAKMSAELADTLPDKVSDAVISALGDELREQVEETLGDLTSDLQKSHLDAWGNARDVASGIQLELESFTSTLRSSLLDLAKQNSAAISSAEGRATLAFTSTQNSLEDLSDKVRALFDAIAELPTAAAPSHDEAKSKAVAEIQGAVTAIAGQLSSLQASNSARQQALEAAVSALSGQVAGATTSLGDRLDQLSATVAEQGAALAAVAPAAAATAAAGSSTPAGSDQASSAVTLSALGVKLDALLAAHTATAQEVAALRGEVAQLAQAAAARRQPGSGEVPLLHQLLRQRQEEWAQHMLARKSRTEEPGGSEGGEVAAAEEAAAPKAAASAPKAFTQQGLLNSDGTHMLSLAACPATKTLATVDKEGYVSLWDLAGSATSAQPKRLFKVQPWQKQVPLALSPDGTKLAVVDQEYVAGRASEQVRVRVFDIAASTSTFLTSPSFTTSTHVTALVWSPVGSRLVVAAGSSVVVWKQEHGANGKPGWVTAGTKQAAATVAGLAWVPADLAVIMACTDGSVQVWGKGGVHPLAIAGGLRSMRWGTRDPVTALALVPPRLSWGVQGSKVLDVAVGDEGGRVGVLDLTQMVRPVVYRHQTGDAAASGGSGAASVTCLAAGSGSSARLLASGAHDGTIRVWANSGNQVQQSVTTAWTAGPLLHAHTGGGVTALAWLGDGRLVSAGEDGGVRLWAPAKED
mmetsp:Transcript_14594/g.36319  ORF Transcript_14594/g.36319 Transcript_14594/m.36319 type:complete len:1137 (-) Transcript_14594:436-3846(-)